ncbi:hypothetical protein PPERSA_02568 [Pseudocohnilembus persalinus]|uniref:Uncharacterized protein n=1 Tax=Pseudocohnilembus persalinus TaxID=266149 RepID=A0A0V0R5R6_PSEPJ|nr:hypothetical protein PPERSA_02568 [Pseudocohnilembus persalinus]|eukprot:KRX09696.1 hypothetical protein PPERSA_02568 [Pseudocohnilembus persalinus]
MNISTVSTQKQIPVINTIPYSSPVKSINDKKLSSSIQTERSLASSKNTRLLKMEQISPSNSSTIKDNSIQIDQEKYTKILEQQITKYRELLDKEIKEHESTKNEFQQLKQKYDAMKENNQLAAEKLIMENNEKQQKNIQFWKEQANLFKEKNKLLEQLMQQTSDLTPHKINKQVSIEQQEFQSQSFLRDLNTLNNQLNHQSQQDLFDQLQLKQQQSDYSYLKTNLNNKNPQQLEQKPKFQISDFQNNNENFNNSNQIELKTQNPSKNKISKINIENQNKNEIKTKQTQNIQGEQLQQQQAVNQNKNEQNGKQFQSQQQQSQSLNFKKQQQTTKIENNGNVQNDDNKKQQQQKQTLYINVEKCNKNEHAKQQSSQKNQKSFITNNETRDFQEDTNNESTANLKNYVSINLFSNNDQCVKNSSNNNNNNQRVENVQIPQRV